ncbi:MAG TPA: DNA gyrase modulator, partial [Actinomycetota bacterium]|nr:DNA gyrase modulator [Actinomycetota bacterium]
MEALIQRALDAAVAAGAAYADARGVSASTEALSVNGPSVESLERADSQGFGVRVLVDGAWGFAASSVLTDEDVSRIALQAVEVGRASATRIAKPVELVPEPVHEARWETAI